MAEKQTTEYLVLERRGGIEENTTPPEKLTWIECKSLAARSAQDAVSSYVRKNGSKGGVFVAVPVRSFKAITVATETQTKLTFS